MTDFVALNDLDAAPATTFHTVVVSDVEEDLFGQVIQRLAAHNVINGLTSAEKGKFFAGLRHVLAFYLGTRKAVRGGTRRVRGRRASIEIPALIVDCAQLLAQIGRRAPRIWITPDTGKECAALQIVREIIAALDKKTIPHQGSLQRQAANAQAMLKNWAEDFRTHLIRSGVAALRV